PADLEGTDAAIHLAGENIAAKRWTPAQKAKIRDSRVSGTRLLAESLARLARQPKVLVCASAIGYYGDRSDERLNEDSAPGSGFLAETCRDWEAAAKPAIDRGIRVVQLRLGLVLASHGGALAKMLPPFRLGIAGIIGSGQQYMSWIALDDLVAAVSYVLSNEGLRGPVNVVAPDAVTNHEFTKTLGRVLRRPTVFPMPAFAARLAFGEMADGLLLSSTRVEPQRLLASGFRFRFPELKAALEHLLR
ncbi:MAG: TIGR01777 family oxidoreductase, partial [Acidobacteria bacterium]|nr:TIGR01777 family oxidoreductase [Acidobacteriota bacterium]